ncbi:MAG: glycine cleavage system aminomethyltransferase GcvT [Cyanobacteria bacterium REEB65]|nr:glycine cleavage system aminomethyltransferase GcvT [Cyanobacteria bacterium REEB65]
MGQALAANLKRTPLYDRHVALGARMVPFGGWDMPVQYSSIVAEHKAVREDVGLFDVSHMGEFLVSGPQAADFLARVVPGSVRELAVGRVIYTQFTNDRGGVVDDLLIYRLEDHYLLVVNASNISKDWQHLQLQLPATGVTLIDASDRTALLALQGPKAAELLAACASPDPRALAPFSLQQGQVLGSAAIVARTGYTGEDGFEIFVQPEHASAVWDGLLARGAQPCGLGARDTLRLEAGLPLYGHEWDDDTTPVEAGFAWTIKSKTDYLGKAPIDQQLAEGTKRRLAGIKMLGRAPAREGYDVFRGDRRIGAVCSGSVAPALGYPIATAYLPPDVAIGEIVHVQVRDQRLPAEIVKMPFYRRPKS